MRSRALWGGIAVSGLLLHLLAAQALYSAGDRLMAWLLLLVFVVIAYRYLRKPGGRIPLLPLVTLEIYMMYGAAQFTQEKILIGDGWYSAAPSTIHAAMLLVISGEAGMLLLFALGERMAKRWKRSWSMLYPSNLDCTKHLAIVYGLLGMLWYFVQNTQVGIIPIEVRNVFQAVLNPYLGLILVLYWAHQAEGRRYRVVGAWMVVAMILSGMLSSMLEIILVPVYLVILADWIWGNVLRTKLAVGAVFFFVLLSPVKYHYRHLAVDAPPVLSVSTLLERVSMWQQAIRRTWDDPFVREKSVEAASDRTSALLSLAQVIEWVPRSVPYNKGEGLAESIFYWIPRIFWRSKPSISDLLNNKYAIAFGYSTPEGVRTSTIGICQPADGYWDWGGAGAILYMSLFGLVLGILFGETGRANQVANVIVMVFSASFFQSLVSLQFLIASLFSLFVGAWLALHSLKLGDAVLYGNGVGIRRARTWRSWGR